MKSQPDYTPDEFREACERMRGYPAGMREVDQIAQQVAAAIPGIVVTQLQITVPADRDVTLFFRAPGISARVQIESNTGRCPFLVGSNFSDEQQLGSSVEEVVAIIKTSVCRFSLSTKTAFATSP